MRAFAVLAAALMLSSCTSDAAVEPAPTSSSPPATGGPATDEPLTLALEPVTSLAQPVAMAVRRGDDGLYMAQKTGTVARWSPHTGDLRLVLDLVDEVSQGSEQGLLGIDFSPDGEQLYVDFTDRDGATRIQEFQMVEHAADPASRRDLLTVGQPFSNHNGGHLAFGPDGYLYIGLGDGGSAGDPDGNAQSLGTLLGKLLRISPEPAPDGTPYSVPPDNPFIDVSDARPEIWAYGLRNPWRFSFDRATGDLWIGDVGQDAWEEVDLQPSGSVGGENYGWDAFEGTAGFEGGLAAEDTKLPVHEYRTGGETCAVTGGFVYRGHQIPSLRGTYVFADFCQGRLEGLAPRSDGGFEHMVLGPVEEGLASFGEDADGELYVLSLIDGEVLRIVATDA